VETHGVGGGAPVSIVRQVVRPYAHALLVKQAALEDPVLTPYQQQALRDSMRVDFRKCSDSLIPRLVPFLVSKAAAAAAAEIGVDLATASYESQPSFDPGRKVFHYEHYATISGLLQAIDAAEDVDTAVEVLVEQLRVAWILKSENRCLDNLGYRHQRPDPAAAYAHAGIELVDPA
jgi:hypothetical protein